MLYLELSYIKVFLTKEDLSFLGGCLFYEEKISIAIDGPSAAGKSTIAKMVAKKENFIYIDTGAMYRSVAFYCIKITLT